MKEWIRPRNIPSVPRSRQKRCVPVVLAWGFPTSRNISFLLGESCLFPFLESNDVHNKFLNKEILYPWFSMPLP
jgi:hypothetical protein